jgi:hypothetical protein
MHRLVLIATLFAGGCGSKSDPPEPASSHESMPNQFEVGSTINERYLVVKKLGEIGDYMLFAVEPASMKDRKLTMIAPKSLHASAARREAMTHEMTEKRLKWIALEQIPVREEHYAVGDLTDAEVRDVLSGTRRLGRN